MPRPGTDDLLSAYFDREVTPTERAAAEQLLESDVAARQELEEIGGLSDLLKALPHETAPDFLLSATLQRAEREALFAHAAAAPVAVARPRRRREWLVVLAGLLTTSAAVLLMVNTLPQARHSADEFAATTVATAESKSAVAELSDPAADRVYFKQSNGAEAEMVAMDGDRTLLGRSAVGKAPVPGEPAGRQKGQGDSFMLSRDGVPSLTRVVTDPAPSAPAARFSSPATEPTSASTTLPGAMNFSDAPADATWNYRGLQEAAEPEFGTVAANNSIRLGQVIPYLAMNRDGAMTVIEFTVIDVDQAADSLEVLLSRNDIKPQSGEKAVDEKLAENRPVADKTRLNGLARKQSGDRSENLVAFYVQTGPELAGRMIRQLESEPWVVKVDLMPPVPGDDLQRESTPVDARQIEEALVRNGIQYGNSAIQNSAGQGLGGARGSLEQSGSGIAAASRPETSLGVALADRRRASGNDSPTQSGAQELQVMQRLELRQRPEVVQLLGDKVAETAKPATRNLPKDRNLEGRLTEKRLAASNNIRMLFILQQNELPGVAPTIPR